LLFLPVSLRPKKGRRSFALFSFRLHTPFSAKARVAFATQNQMRKGDQAMTNCFDMRCPKCGSEDQIDIAATVWVRLTRDGTDADEAAEGGRFWDDDSAARCAACDHQGTVKDFEA
jgi:hypothetical protein